MPGKTRTYAIKSLQLGCLVRYRGNGVTAGYENPKRVERRRGEGVIDSVSFISVQRGSFGEKKRSQC